LKLRVPALLDGAGSASCLEAATAAARREADLAYLDPPYNQHSYLGNYHVWESLARWDKPEVYGVAMKRTDVRERRSPFTRLWAGAETLEGRGVLAPPVLRHLRAMKDRDTPPPTCEDLALEAFPGLPVRRALAGYAPLERRGVRVEAYVRRIESSRDGDFHLK